jgi:hypothetical protein
MRLDLSIESFNFQDLESSTRIHQEDGCRVIHNTVSVRISLDVKAAVGAAADSLLSGRKRLRANMLKSNFALVQATTLLWFPFLDVIGSNPTYLSQ